jgi:hypothetical protein
LISRERHAALQRFAPRGTDHVPDQK